MGEKYARKYDKYGPECVAEANYILTELATNRPQLLDAADNPESYLRITMVMRLRDYFAPLAYSEKTGISPRHARTIGELKQDPHDDIEMIGWLELVFPEYRNLTLLLRDGFDLHDMVFLHRANMKPVRQMLKYQRKMDRQRRKDREHTRLSVPQHELQEVIDRGRHSESVEAAQSA